MDVLGEALKQGIAPAIVVVIYLIIVKIIDNRRHNNQIKISTELSKSINEISNFISILTKNIIDKDKDKCKNAIEDSMYASGMRLVNFVTNTIINNHINTNKENILANIHNIVNAEYYTIYSVLAVYTINDCKVSDILNKKWIDDIENDIIEIIYNNVLTNEEKIISFNNKINIRFQSYITYITNNALKN